MGKHKSRNKMTLSLTLDAEDMEKFLIVKEAHPHIKRNSDIIRKGIYKLHSQMRIDDREECKQRLIEKGLLPDGEGE